MSFRSRLAYVSRGKINFCAVKFRAAALLLSHSPSYLLSYCSVFSNALEFQQSYVLMQNLSTYRGLPRSVADEILPLVVACGIYLLRMHVIARILLPQAAALLTPIVVGFRLLLHVYFCAL